MIIGLENLYLVFFEWPQDRFYCIQKSFFGLEGKLVGVVARSRFLGDTGVPHLKFKGTFANFGVHTKFIFILFVN